MTTDRHLKPNDPRARHVSTVDQLVFRWDTGNRSGNTGFGLVAWSCEDERAEKVRGLARTLQVAGDDVAPGLVRMGVKARDETLLVHRSLGHDPGGRAGTVCHALLGPAEMLDVEICLGLHHWSWEGSDLPLHETRGRLSPVSADALLGSAQGQWNELTRRLPDVTGPLSCALAEVLRNPGSRHSFLDGHGGDLPHLVLWGLYGMLGQLRPEHRYGWSFATHDTDDSQPFRFVFVPRWPASAAHDDRRVRADLQRPTDDRALDLAVALVRHHLEWSHRGGDGPSRVPSALAAAAQDVGRVERGDALLVAARRAVEHLDARGRPRRSAAAPPVREVRKPRPEQEQPPRRGDGQGSRPDGGSSAPPTASERPTSRADVYPAPGPGSGSGSDFGRGSGSEAVGSRPAIRRDDGLAARTSPSARSFAAPQTSSDDDLLYALEADLSEEETVLVLLEIRRRFQRWPSGPRAHFAALALDMLLNSASVSASAYDDARDTRSGQGPVMPPDSAPDLGPDLGPGPGLGPGLGPDPGPDSDSEGSAPDRHRARSHDRPRDRPRGGSHARSDAGTSVLTRLAAGFGFTVRRPTADPATRTHLPEDDADSHASPKSEEDSVSRWAVGLMVALIVACVLVIVLRIA